jgi:two-component system, OmpR family, phosphate regulon sensor histidine kinase PhoR
MSSWLRRIAFVALAVLLAATAAALSNANEAMHLLAVIGAAMAAATVLLVREGSRARRLLEWLRGNQQGGAPRDPGAWGELAYRIERALRQRDNETLGERQRLVQFLDAIEASPNGVLMLDANEQIQWSNKVAADHFGLDPQRDRLQRMTNLVRQPAFVAYLQGGAFDEALQLHNLQDRRSLSVIVRPYGEGMKLILSQDVTERERSEAMRRDFVANVSHEIRTPLTVLAGFVETMAQVPLTEVERGRVLELMGQQTQRMQALVSDLLTLAQLEGSPRPPPDRWFAFSALLHRIEADAGALSMLRHQLDFSGGEDAEVAGSETELQSAVFNLVANAVHYTPEGGRIAVAWRWREGGGALVEVSDNGVGIAREHLSRLTERFYRVDGSRSRETGGTGLGLSIVKHVIQRHGGSIDISSEPGQGSCFSLQLPAARVRRGAAEPSVGAEESALASAKANAGEAAPLGV